MQGELTLRLSSSWMYIAYTSLLIVCFRPFVDELTKRGEEFRVVMHVKYLLFMHIYLFCLWAFIEYPYYFCYAWLNGELLWSLSLIHTYITPWVLSSSKRERLLAQRPFTLVLMIINSCSYSTNDLMSVSYTHLTLPTKRIV